MSTHDPNNIHPSRRLRRTIIQLLLAVVCAASAHAQTARTTNDQPSAERLREFVTYLASDKLEGRRTGTPGAEAAAQYIAAEFKRLGLRPGASVQVFSDNSAIDQQARSYYQPFPYIAGVTLGQTNAMTFTPKTEIGTGVVPVPTLDLRVGEDWMPLSWSANGRVERSPVVYVGYGITATDLNHDDYAGVDVQDKIEIG